MAIWQRPSVVTLLAGHLRAELLRGRWVGRMPGVIRLARELGAARNTVEAALRELEKEGLLVPQGHGRGRMIAAARSASGRRGLRVRVLLYDARDRGLAPLIAMQHQLEQAGHVVSFARKSLSDLRQDPRRVAALVKEKPADAWIVLGGSLEVLEWFAARGLPVFALFGRRRELMIAGAGPDKPRAYAEATRELIRLGHRRIALLCAPERRIPEPGASERAFLAEMEAHGIPVGRYQLPEWDGGMDDFHRCLEGLFGVTPPTALIVDEDPLFAATLQFLGRRQLRVPEDVSMVCTDRAEWFGALRPTVAHIHWDPRPVIRRVLDWTANVSRGKRDVRQIETPAEFVPGGTIGTAT